MEGRFVPEGYFGLEPAYRNFFESVPSVRLSSPPPLPPNAFPTILAVRSAVYPYSCLPPRKISLA
eukprot:6027898-Pleurochrysis_carterae.AAC.3